MSQKSPRRVSSKRIQSFLKSSEWTLDSELTAQIPENIYTSAIYKNSDGNILQVLSDGSGNLYESTEDWLSLLEEVEALRHQEPTHVLHERLPQGQDFINQVPELVHDLATKLGISPQQLDKSGRSLEIVDRAIRRKGRRKCLEPEIFAPLVAYAGEVLQQRIGGHWEMRATEYPEVWEPWVIDAQGRGHQPYIIVYDELDESPTCSLYAVIGVEE